MPGRNQHHIPRQFLRGFATKGKAKAMQLFVGRAGGQVYKTSVDKIGAERDFYSDPPALGVTTLDDAITDYEDRLLVLLDLLRAHSVGSTVDAETAAEVIAHLVPRSSSLRSIAEVGITKLLKGAEQLMAPENVTKLLELDRPEPNELVSKELSEALRAQLGKKQSPIPIDVMERMLYAALQENGGDFAKNSFPEISTFLAIFQSEAPKVIRDSHRKVLTENLVQPVRKTQLASFHWSLAEAPKEGAILSDCIAITIEVDSNQASPLMGAEMDRVATVIMPVTAQVLLIGKRQAIADFDVRTYNLAAATCSSIFFVSQQRMNKIEVLASKIGQATDQSMEIIVSQSLARTIRQPETANTDGTAAPWMGTFSYSIQLPGAMSPEQIALVNETVKRAISLLSPNGGIKIVSGLSFPAHVLEKVKSLAQLHGQDVPPTEGVLASYLHRYVDEGQSKVEIVMDETFAWGLVNEEEETSNYSLQWLLAEIGEAEFLGLLDRAFPGILQKRFTESHRESLATVLIDPLSGYFRMKCAGGGEAFSRFEEMTLNHAIHLLTRPNEALEQARSTYTPGGEIDDVFAAQLSLVRDRLIATALYVALLANDSFLAKQRQSDFEAALEKLGLTKWLPRWELDLRRLWERRMHWDSIEEFYALNFHVERMLWGMQTVVWPIEDKRTYVYFM